ncbi:MAG: hypothetical protein M3076_19950 [Actinomycetota bacterium]|nr:hypothetical protein [Actinomycetota bacterium]
MPGTIDIFEHALKTSPAVTDDVTIYRSDADEAIERLAQLDSAKCPSGPLLAAAIDGQLLAALPLAGGRAIANPFARTAELVALLELRVAQLNGRPSRGRSARLVTALRRRSASGTSTISAGA